MLYFQQMQGQQMQGQQMQGQRNLPRRELGLRKLSWRLWAGALGSRFGLTALGCTLGSRVGFARWVGGRRLAQRLLPPKALAC